MVGDGGIERSRYRASRDREIEGLGNGGIGELVIGELEDLGIWGLGDWGIGGLKLLEIAMGIWGFPLGPA